MIETFYNLTQAFSKLLEIRLAVETSPEKNPQQNYTVDNKLLPKDKHELNVRKRKTKNWKGGDTWKRWGRGVVPQRSYVSNTVIFMGDLPKLSTPYMLMNSSSGLSLNIQVL